ncbi:ATP-binding protein [Polaribacter sp. L3A8]|uniref:ATP-binding protein n=1 Tax=Polaribacter sp. L3A8 TaxID=2686361 RepID=UPI00131AA028|nr:ATP-binding protein [Polaribacter sp. L3A8]
MKIKLPLILFFFTLFSFSQKEASSIYTSISFFKQPSKDVVSIKEIIKNYELGRFQQEKKPKIYKNLGENTLWNHFLLPQSTTENDYKYFTIANPYLPYGKIYLKKGDKIDSLYRVSNNKEFPHKNIFYRHPVWKLPIDTTQQTEVFLKVKNKDTRTRLSYFLETENQFLKRVETEYFYFGMYIAFLICMALILVFFAVIKKEYAVLFYALYIFTVLIEFLAGKGIGVQYFWSASEFAINNIRSLSQTIGVASIGCFYLKFYKLNKSQAIPKLLFKIGAYIALALLLFYLYKFFFGGLVVLYLYVWTILKVIAFIWILNHLYLTITKQLPIYLVIAFILPIIAIISGQIINPSVYNNLAITFSGSTIYYIALALEILLFTRFIFGSVIEAQFKYFKLKKVSDELKYNFQNKTLAFQHTERNNLVNNVHDTFGGYLEALKLRLLQNDEKSPEKVKEILDAFYNDYRYLLNSLYAPKINSDNFIESLIEFCTKIDNLTKHKINYNFNLKNIELSQDKCVHLYRVISELTTNAIKYSKATEIKISMNDHKNQLIILNVTDNGIGFNEDLVLKKGFGLESVKKRVEQIEGTLKIDTSKKGSNFEIKIPIIND